MTTPPVSTTESSFPGFLRIAILPLGLLLLLGGGCATGVGGRRPAPATGLAGVNRSEPALSGDGRLLASLIEEDGRQRLILQELASGRRLPLPQWRGRTPHGSPSLSWNGRYLAGLVQQGSQRRVVVEDRLSGRLLPLLLPGGGQPQRLTLAPDGQTLAVEVLRDGQRLVQVFGLQGMLEPDLPGGSAVLGGGPSP